MAAKEAERDEVILGDNGSLVRVFCDAVDHGAPSLKQIPGLLKRILQTSAWRRLIRHGKVYENSTFAGFITEKPYQGCGYDPSQIEKLIEHDVETLAMWRDAMTRGDGRPPETDDNITSLGRVTGTSKSYTVSRLRREAPGLFERVKEGTISANAAAIEAGFRRKPTPFEQIVRLLRKLDANDKLRLKEML